MHAHLVRIGNSMGIRIPKPFLQQCDLHDDVEIELIDKKIIITARKEEEWTLDKIIDGLPAHTALTEEEKEWLNEKPKGNELI